ncbi:hypothetical protein G3I60_04180 [Streptomyces sp. SID13666]|uniref:hypothetical protein n=1 Tax=Streptomyces TaxID=1883 RepID=UPI00110580CB|nr:MULTISPECIES: hypothetical protein [Streptomyces]NEA53379.1 hypothetical protein [Streptomyces sp. SID13666]NEA69294.1 hypothetical protein [Streptomyces sp. SID13588]QNA70750.1 hypothetical protein C8250_001235 [Streptomyces sp. So13.3]
MRIRSLLGAAATAVLLITGLTTTAVAQVPETSGSGRTMVMPAAPLDAGPRAVAAASPSVSPYAPSQHYPAGTTGVPCSSGNFCTAVWDYSTGSWEVFRFDPCATYSVSSWDGNGSYWNQQTGSRATATFYGQSGNLLASAPISATPAGYDWSPVYSIRNCY